MDTEFWQRRWEAGQIGFHQGSPNPFLVQWWSSLGVPAGATVLVPLCGKTHDLHWLASLGHPVVGVEFSALAVAAFFEERGWAPEIRDDGPFRVWSANGVTIWQGDWWAFPRDSYAAIYDRAATIALPADLRARHAEALRQHGGAMLLVTLRHDSTDGPPFSVTEAEVRATWDDAELLESVVVPDEPGRATGRVEEIWRVVSHR